MKLNLLTTTDNNINLEVASQNSKTSMKNKEARTNTADFFASYTGSYSAKDTNFFKSYTGPVEANTADFFASYTGSYEGNNTDFFAGYTGPIATESLDFYKSYTNN